jgi:hypothetical protein
VSIDAHLPYPIQPNAYCQNVLGVGTLSNDGISNDRLAKSAARIADGCSTNPDCDCANAWFIGSICTQKPTCHCLQQCIWKGDCPSANSTCVVDARCGSQALCYPISLFSEETCPTSTPAKVEDVLRNKRHLPKGKKA